MNIFKGINIKGFGKKYTGKVRDCYITKDKIFLIATDRISAFDKVLGCVPYKGQVLTLLSKFWFEKTKDIVQNHLIKVLDPNVLVVKKCKVIPIEMVVRGYISGVTGTSIWGSYQKGERLIYGVRFKEGLRKNQKLPKPVITPTTKAKSGHDQRLTRDEIIRKKIVPEKTYREMEKVALKLFRRGTRICAKRGIILVDTKYEFGLDENKKLMLIDEIHTPDSSRFWIKKTYKKRFQKGLEPENFDKEFMRLWFKKKNYTGRGKPPKLPPSFILKISKRYQDICSKIIGHKIKPDRTKKVEEKIISNLKQYDLYN